MIRIFITFLIGSRSLLAQEEIPCSEILGVVNNALRTSLIAQEDVYTGLVRCKDVELETWDQVSGSWIPKLYRAVLLESKKECTSNPEHCRYGFQTKLPEFLRSASKVFVGHEANPPPIINFMNYNINMGYWPPLDGSYGHVSTSIPRNIIPLSWSDNRYYTEGSRRVSFSDNREPGGTAVETFKRTLNESDNEVIRINDEELFPTSQKRWEYYLYPRQSYYGCEYGGDPYPNGSSWECLGFVEREQRAETLVMFKLPDNYEPPPDPTPSPFPTPSPTATPICTSLEETKERLFDAVNKGQTLCGAQPRSELHKVMRKIMKESCEPVDFTLKSAAEYIDARKSSLILPGGCDTLTQKVVELARYRLYNSGLNADRLSAELIAAGFTCYPAYAVHPFKYGTIFPELVMLRLSKKEAKRRKLRGTSEKKPMMEGFVITDAVDPDSINEFERLNAAIQQGNRDQAIREYNKKLSKDYKSRRKTTRFRVYGNNEPFYGETSLGEAEGRTLICIPPRAKIDPESGTCSVPFESLKMSRTYENWKIQREAERVNLPSSESVSGINEFSGIEKNDLPSQLHYFERLAIEGLKEWCGGELPPEVPSPRRLLSEKSSKAHTVALARVIGRYFPGIRAMGGYRGNSRDKNGHPAGLAIDVMVPDSTNYGLAAAEFALFLNRYYGSKYVNYTIWNRKLGRIGKNNYYTIKSYTGSNPHIDHPHINLQRLPSSISMPYRSGRAKLKK